MLKNETEIEGCCVLQLQTHVGILHPHEWIIYEVNELN